MENMDGGAEGGGLGQGGAGGGMERIVQESHHITIIVIIAILIEKCAGTLPGRGQGLEVTGQLQG